MTRTARYPYCDTLPEGPDPVEIAVTRRARFEEVDSLGIARHGRYPSYLEDARDAFACKYGLGYSQMVDNGFVAATVSMHLDYRTALRLGDDFTVAATLYWTPAIRLDFCYRGHEANGAQLRKVIPYSS